MNTSDTLAALISDGAPMFIKAVEAVPEDKLDWKPAEGSRSIRQLVREVVMIPAYIARALAERQVPPYEEMDAEYKRKSVPELLELLRPNIDALSAAMRAFPESDYGQELTAPWGTWTYFQTMSYPYWNLMWHTGQINYIQTMYGDQNFY